MLRKLLALAAFAVALFALSKLDAFYILSAYGTVLMFYLLSKMSLSFFYRPFRVQAPPPPLKVAAVIPSYNESGDALIETLESVAAQTYPVDSIYIVDDGSADPSGIRQVEAYVQENIQQFPHVVVQRNEENKGKRHAQAWAFTRSDADVFFTIDSDTYVYPDALAELMKTFSDPKIYAATGHISARNRDANFLSKLIDIRYHNAFRVERAAQTMTGNILTCSGPLSVYRREVIVPNLERYLNQRFLGVTVNIGDDRCLTNYANKLGRTAYQSTARATTDVPTSIRIFIRQQIRWNKSFFRETIESMKLIAKRPAVAVWSMIELALFVLLNFSLVNFIVGNFNHFDPIVLLFVLLAICGSAFARNIHYAFQHPLLFLLAPFYGILHIILLQPIRLYALLTIRDVRWGTRKVAQ